jgi:hypothetical protein
MERRSVQRGGWAGHSAARVMSVLAVTGALLGSLARPAAAQILNDPSTPLRMDFLRLDCYDEDDDGLLDLHSEPYLVVFAADISGPTPRVATVRSKVFGDVDGGETHYSNPVVQVWDFDGTGSPILNPDKLIFLGALLESDHPYDWGQNERANRVVQRVNADLFTKLFGYHAAGLSRDTIVGKLTKDMEFAINEAINFDEGPGTSKDDRIGSVQELRLTMDDVLRARSGPWVPVTKTLVHKKKGADYRTTFVLQPTTIIIY